MTNQEKLILLDKYKMCHKCEKAKQLPNRKFCAQCLEKIQISNIERYNSEKAHEYQTRRRELYQEHKANGICVRCSKPATHGLYCYEHSIKAKKHSAEMAQKRKWQRHERGLIPAYREQNNLCYYCGTPVEDKQHHGRACNACAKIMSEHSLKGDKTYWRAWRDAFWKGFAKK